MDIDKQIGLSHLLLSDRKCRVCGEVKNLIESFYRTRKDRGAVASSYSYECKECTVGRIVRNRKKKKFYILTTNTQIGEFTSRFPHVKYLFNK